MTWSRAKSMPVVSQSNTMIRGAAPDTPVGRSGARPAALLAPGANRTGTECLPHGKPTAPRMTDARIRRGSLPAACAGLLVAPHPRRLQGQGSSAGHRGVEGRLRARRASAATTTRPATGYEIANGALSAKGAHNHPLWLRKKLPRDVRIELDCWSNEERGDIKVELFGDGRSFDPDGGAYMATGYELIFGGWFNSQVDHRAGSTSTARTSSQHVDTQGRARHGTTTGGSSAAARRVTWWRRRHARRRSSCSTIRARSKGQGTSISGSTTGRPIPGSTTS